MRNSLRSGGLRAFLGPTAQSPGSESGPDQESVRHLGAGGVTSSPNLISQPPTPPCPHCCCHVERPPPLAPEYGYHPPPLPRSLAPFCALEAGICPETLSISLVKDLAPSPTSLLLHGWFRHYHLLALSTLGNKTVSPPVLGDPEASPWPLGNPDVRSPASTPSGSSSPPPAPLRNRV